MFIRRSVWLFTVCDRFMTLHLELVGGGGQQVPGHRGQAPIYCNPTQRGTVDLSSYMNQRK